MLDRAAHFAVRQRLGETRIFGRFEPDGGVGIDGDPFHGDRPARLADWLLGRTDTPERLHAVAIRLRDFLREGRLQQAPLADGGSVILPCLAVQPSAEMMEPCESGYARHPRRVL